MPAPTTSGAALPPSRGAWRGCWRGDLQGCSGAAQGLGPTCGAPYGPWRPASGGSRQGSGRARLLRPIPPGAPHQSDQRRSGGRWRGRAHHARGERPTVDLLAGGCQGWQSSDLGGAGLLSWCGVVDDSALVLGYLLEAGPETGFVIRWADQELRAIRAVPDRLGLQEAPSGALGCGHGVNPDRGGDEATGCRSHQ